MTIHRIKQQREARAPRRRRPDAQTVTSGSQGLTAEQLRQRRRASEEARRERREQERAQQDEIDRQVTQGNAVAARIARLRTRISAGEKVEPRVIRDALDAANEGGALNPYSHGYVDEFRLFCMNNGIDLTPGARKGQ